MSLLPNPDVYRHPPAVLDSPGLYRDAAETPAFEVKFLLSSAEAREVERRLRGRLAPDPHADPALGGAYRVTSVYFDTPALDVYRRSDGYRRRKYRVRRYGDAPRPVGTTACQHEPPGETAAARVRPGGAACPGPQPARPTDPADPARAARRSLPAGRATVPAVLQELAAGIAAGRPVELP